MACRLCRVLNEMGDKTAIIFVNTKKNADSLSRQLDKAGYRVTTLHGGKTQEQREVHTSLFQWSVGVSCSKWLQRYLRPRNPNESTFGPITANTHSLEPWYVELVKVLSGITVFLYTLMDLLMRRNIFNISLVFWFQISLEGFRNKRFNCLVATDVAGRGIDIPVSW